MSETSCDVRVLVRCDDGMVGVYAVDGIPSASRLRDDLACAGNVFSDPEVGEDCLAERDDPTCVREVFAQVQRALTVAGQAVLP